MISKLYCKLLWILLFGSLILAGCGGGGGKRTDNDPGGGGFLTVSEETVSQVLNDAHTNLLPLFQSDTQPSAEAIRNKMAAISNLNVKTVTDNGVVVAEIGGSGGPLVIIAPPTPAGSFNSASASLNQLNRPMIMAASSHKSLPKGSKVLLLNGFDGSTLYKDITPKIKQIFTDCDSGYAVTTQLATIENLRNVKDIDVFFIKTHGERMAATAPYPNHRLDTYCLSTVSRVDLQAPFPSNYSTDILKHNIVFMWVPTDRTGILFKDFKYEWVFGITAGFVTDHWQLNKGGMAFIGACSSANPAAGPFQQSVFDSGASTYFGWDQPIETDFADNRVQFLFDRLLGANVAVNQIPPQRPFPYQDVYREMVNKSMVTWPGDEKHVASTLKILDNPADDNFGILEPNIKYVEVDEKYQDPSSPSRLTLYGTFGKEEGRVTVDGVELTRLSWSEDKIICEITDQPTAAGAAGDVVVEIRGHKSNSVPLTLWKVVLTYTMISDGSLQEYLTVTGYLRGDIHRYRETSGGNLVNGRLVQLSSMRGGVTGNYRFFGEYLQDGVDQTILTTWTGGQSLTNLTVGVGMNLTVNSSAQASVVESLSLLAQTHKTITTTWTDSSGSTSESEEEYQTLLLAGPRSFGLPYSFVLPGLNNSWGLNTSGMSGVGPSNEKLTLSCQLTVQNNTAPGDITVSSYR